MNICTARRTAILAASAIGIAISSFGIAAGQIQGSTPPTLDSPDWRPERFVTVATPDGDIVRSVDGRPVLVDMERLDAVVTRGKPSELVLWKIFGEDTKDQADADARLTAVLEGLSNGEVDPALLLALAD